MRPEWVTAIVGLIGLGLAVVQVVSLVILLRMRVEVNSMKDQVLDRVGSMYQRQDVCRAEMSTLRAQVGL